MAAWVGGGDRFGGGEGPVEEEGAVSEVGGDGAMRGDESGGGGEGFLFGAEKVGIGAEIGEGGGVGVVPGGFVEAFLELLEGPAGEEDIEGAAAEGAE